MKNSTLHLIGAALLLTAVFITWPKTKEVPTHTKPQASARQALGNSEPKKSPSPRHRPSPILETPLVQISSSSLFLRLSSAGDIQTALAQVRELPPSLRRDEAIAKLIAKMEPQQAMEEWLKWKHARTDPWLKAASEICLKLAQDDPFTPADFINEHIPESARFEIWNDLFHTMDFQSTANVLATLPLHRDTIKHASHVARNWIQTDPQACLTWLDQYLPQLSHEQVTDLLQASYYNFTGYLEPDLDQRIAAFNQATHPTTRDFLARLVLTTRTSDKDTLSKFLDDLAETMPDLHRERTAAADSDVQKIYANPEGFANSLDSQRFKSLALRDWQILISKLSGSNPALAAETLVKFGDIRGSQLSSALILWHKIEPNKALYFARKLPKTEVHQKAIYNFANKIAYSKNKEVTEQLIALLTSAKEQEKIRAILADQKN